MHFDIPADIADFLDRLDRFIDDEIKPLEDVPDFISDQFAQVEKIYEALDLPMSGDGADQMRAFMDDSRRNDMSEAVRLRTARWGHRDNHQHSRYCPTSNMKFRF